MKATPLIAVALVAGAITGCSSGTTCEGQTSATARVVLNANATPPLAVGSGTARLDRVEAKPFTRPTAVIEVYPSQELSTPTYVEARAGDRVTIAAAEFTVLWVCSIASNGAPGSSSGSVGLD